ncbi:MAG: type IV secretion system protein [Alphaproteobacteria bacterium]|nr:type IV secretion system protein [Rickettsiales bacterium]
MHTCKEVHAKNYAYKSNCIKNLFGLENHNLPPEGEVACTVNRVGIAMLRAATGSTTAITGVLMYMALLYQITATTQGDSSLCPSEIHPMPYNDELIAKYMRTMGEPVTPRSIVEHYDQICFVFRGSFNWIGKDECVSRKGILFCSSTPDWSDQMLCVKIASTCPCVGHIGSGTLDDPKFKKDGDVYITDANGNAEIESEDNFRRYFAKHCNMTLNTDSMPLTPAEYTGIIDEICNSWKGYSKASLTLTSGAVQCLQSTMQNIFQKPLGSIANDNVGNFEIDESAKIKLEMLNKDKIHINEMVTEAKEMLLNVAKVPLKTNNEYSTFTGKVLTVSSGAGLLSEYKKDYRLNLSKMTVDNVNEEINTHQLSRAIGELETLSKSIEVRTRSFLESIQKSSKIDAFTMFESVQAHFKIISIFMIILYITITGSNIILGNFDMSVKNLLEKGMQLGIIYYFAMGDAWKQYFYRMVFDVSIGVSTVVFESIIGDSELDRKCNFTHPYYITEKNDTCLYPNKTLNGSTVPQSIGNNRKTGQPVYVCVKGPFIFRPEYERPYKPITYYEIEASGLKVVKMLQMHCVDKSTFVTEKATLITDDVTKEPKRWTCSKQNFSLEEGYRVGELVKTGMDVINIEPYLGLTGVLQTAMFLPDKSGDISDLFPPRSSPTSRIKEKIMRFRSIAALETTRSNINQQYRQYPEIIKYGITRTFEYIGLFDMMDCKLLGYFLYNTVDGFQMFQGADFLGILFGGIIVIVLLVLILMQGIFIATIVGRIVQSYLVAIIAITVLIYFTPIILPLQLFEATHGIGSDWVEKIKSYAFYPAILFMSAGVSFAVIDYSMYGSSETFQSKSMFNSKGNIDGRNCWNNDWSSAPTACLISKLQYYPNRVRFLGLSFNAGPKPDLALKAIFATVKTAIIVLMLTTIIEQFEKTMTSIFGMNVDVSINNSVFNSPSGLKDLFKKGLSKVKEAGAKIKSTIGKAKGGK